MPGSQPIQSLLRGMEVLQAVADSEDGVRLGDLARRLGLKAPTVHHLVRTLRSRGFLEQSAAGGRYRLGPAVYALVRQGRDGRLLSLAEPLVRSLAAELPRVVITLTEARGGELPARLRASPERPGVVLRPLDRVMSPYATASGLLFLALLEGEERLLLEQRYPFGEFGAHLWGCSEALEEYLQDVRRRGWARHPFAGPSHQALAAPVRDADGSVAACLGACLPVGAADEERVRRRLCESAARITKLLAGTPEDGCLET